MTDRRICPVCAHSVRVLDGKLVRHDDPRWGRTGECPGSGVECKKDPRTSVRTSGA